MSPPRSADRAGPHDPAGPVVRADLAESPHPSPALDGHDPEDLLHLDQQVCFALAVAARNVIGLYRPVLEPMGLTHPQYLVMLALWEHAPLTQKEIGALLSLEPATVSPLVKRLEAAGLVVRERHPHDERALQVTLTPRGADLRAQALLVPPQIIERLGMEVAQLQELHGSLTRVIVASRPDEPT
jgi:MarR family transcriptional regulator, organic hydroperoxide resistance regulator